MPAQASFPGFDVPAKPADRLFFAVFPDAEAAEHIAQLAQQLRSQHGLRGKPLNTGRLHVTLHHLGDYAGLRQDIIAQASQAASSLRVLQPFEIAFDLAASFSSTPRNRPFVLRGGEGLVALTAFQQALGTAMKRVGLGQWAKPAYTPHVTLLYDDQVVAEQNVTPVAWTAREFVLVHSLIGQNRHVALQRWALHG